MLKHDNLLGLMPSIENASWKSAWKQNNDISFQCCLVSRVCLDRAQQKLLVYFDARGVPTVKYPLLSCIITVLEGREKRYGLQAVKFTSFLDKAETPGRYKGVLTFPIREFIKHPTGKFYFIYANSSVWNGDFEPIENFEIKKDMKLKNIKHNFFVYPFVN